MAKHDRKEQIENADTPSLLLGNLLKAQGFAESAPATVEPTVKTSKDIPDLSRSPKIVLRRERKGRGGKTVTIVTGLALAPTAIEQLAKTMRKGLGCGSTVEDGAIVLLGDIAPRAQTWLIEHGAKKVILGN